MILIAHRTPGTAEGARQEAVLLAGDGSSSGSGGDYFVPWHIPFHRVAAAAAAARPQVHAGEEAKDTAHREAACTPGAPSRGGPVSGPEGQEGCAGGTIDRGKGTVVFRRYYHLFDEGELDALVARTPGVRLESSFYDKSNWCAVFARL